MVPSNSLSYKYDVCPLAKFLCFAAYKVAPYVVETRDKISNASTTFAPVRVVAQCRDTAGCKGCATKVNLTVRQARKAS